MVSTDSESNAMYHEDSFLHMMFKLFVDSGKYIQIWLSPMWVPPNVCGEYTKQPVPTLVLYQVVTMFQLLNSLLHIPMAQPKLP